MFNKDKKEDKQFSELINNIKLNESIIIGGSTYSNLTNYKTALLRNVSKLNDIELLSDKECDINELLFELRNEMYERHELFAQQKIRDITMYNEKASDKQKLKTKVIVLNNMERLFDDLSSMTLLVKTLLPKIRIVGIVIIAIMNTSSIANKERPFFTYSKIREYRKPLANFPVRIALSMNTEKESELLIGSSQALNLEKKNKLIKTQSYIYSEIEELDFKY
ncbi:hypothetical protein [Staphylococcus equorum]|uniref:Uncharacterized protein n=1 Tax=Staphylococcus equorum TaxID=246432 RepID=A0AAP7IF34_9STAP|nr:hypothetical protein [Staphylococcus equorum]OEK58915.1 hypothetical protein ASS94_00910 [Staphylococcus equorum]